MPWSFLIVPVGIGALLLAPFAFVWHNLVARGANKGDTWPFRWCGARRSAEFTQSLHKNKPDDDYRLLDVQMQLFDE
jgi:hypothetical protein